MAVTFLKRSTLPAPIKGKVGTMNVMIGANGQVVLSSLATKALDGAKKVVLGFEDGNVLLFPESNKYVKTVKDEDKIDLRFPKKGGTSGFSGSAILRDDKTFGTHIYDFKASGNQSFPVVVNTKYGCISFAIPEGNLVPKPVIPRAKAKKKVTTTGTRAEAGSVSAINAKEVEDLPELIPA